MPNVEIRIWANPAGFVELTKQLPSFLFTKEEKKAFNPDGFDVCRIRDFFTIYYAAQSYVVTYHFLPQSRKVTFRDPRTLLSVVIPRGYKLTNLYNIFVDLKTRYENVINEQLSDINQVGDVVSLAAQEWANLLTQQLEDDKMQPLINQPGQQQGMGYVLFSDSTDLGHYLNAPVRMEFRGAGVMLLIPNDPYELEQNRSFLNNFQHVKAEPVYTPKFSLYFPATGQNIPIAIISSLDDTINQTFSPPYCEPMTLTGRLYDHINDWAITPTADRTGYNIGLQFKRTTKRLKVFVDLISVLQEHITAKDISKWLLPSVGNLIKDNNDYWLVLIGEQIALLKSINFSSNKETYLIQHMIHGEDCITVVVQEVFYYDVPVLRQHILNIYKFLPIVSLYNNGQWQRTEQRVPWLGHKETNRVRIEESDEYEELNFTMADDFHRLKLIKKKGLELNVCFQGELRRWLEYKSPKAKVIVRQYIDENSSGSDVEIEARKKWRQEIDLNNPVLILPAVKENRRYSFEAPGFQKEVIVITPYDGDNVFHLNLKPKVSYILRPTKERLLYAFFGLVLGLAIVPGYQYINNLTSTNSTEQQQGQQGGQQGQQEGQQQGQQEGQQGQQEGQQQGQQEGQQEGQQGQQEGQQQGQQGGQQGQQGGQQGQQGGQQGQQGGQQGQQGGQQGQQAGQQPKKPSNELTELMAKLDGIEFTAEDYNKALNLARAEGLYESYYKSILKDRYTILCACEQSKGKIEPFKALLNLQTISQQQKTAIQKIIADEVAFSGIQKKKYSNLQEILKQLQ